jgi:hypothetical protein
MHGSSIYIDYIHLSFTVLGHHLHPNVDVCRCALIWGFAAGFGSAKMTSDCFRGINTGISGRWRVLRISLAHLEGRSQDRPRQMHPFDAY